MRISTKRRYNSMSTYLDYVSTAEMLKNMDDVYILTHQSPDGDTIGSGFALYYALTGMGKRAKVLCSDKFHKKYGYITDNYVDLDFEPKYVVSTDVADVKLLGTLKATYADSVHLCIDHHISNLEYSKYLLLSPNSSANCEVMYTLLKTMGVRFTEQIAKCLYTGIATDTGCFKFSNCNADTHIITGKLMAEFPNIKYADINRRMFDVKSVSRIKTEREALDNITYYLDGKVAVVYVSYDMIQRLNISLDDFEGLTGLSTQTEGVEVGITLKETEEGIFKVSLRSVGYVNVSEVCQRFGGGGHVRASGCKFSNTTASEVVTKLVDAIAEVL
jgi:phosphoesterase RecJ-like protein